MIDTFIQWLALIIIAGAAVTLMSVVGLFAYLGFLALGGGDENGA